MIYIKRRFMTFEEQEEYAKQYNLKSPTQMLLYGESIEDMEMAREYQDLWFIEEVCDDKR